MKSRSLLGLVLVCVGCSGTTVPGGEGTSGGANLNDPAACSSGPLEGASYNLDKSRFAFGSKPTREDAGTLERWVGSLGVVAIEKSSGSELGIMNAGAPESSVPDWSQDPASLEAHVREYLASMGIQGCQIARTTVTAGTDGRTIGLVRGFDAITVVESIAFAHMNQNDQSTSESFYWPEVPADVVSAARELRHLVADPAQLAIFKAKLPAQAQGDGQVVIHHSGSVSIGAFRAAATYDVQSSAGDGRSSTLSFDADANAVPMDW